MRLLGCRHGFHMDCVDVWLQDNGTCPKCKRDAGVMHVELTSAMEAGQPDPLAFGAGVEVVFQPPAVAKQTPPSAAEGSSIGSRTRSSEGGAGSAAAAGSSMHVRAWAWWRRRHILMPQQGALNVYNRSLAALALKCSVS